ncbi:TM2 domain-containing protein [Arthrobacter sp. NPDC056727]|uniref:TM2 domain-containing protein n=1 Tax=Arthrobacter sp. NPDC056727 TaxID=3345927 RepID=UPI00366B0A49
MTHPGAEQPAAAPEPELPAAPQPSAYDSSQPAWNSSPVAPAPTVPPAQQLPPAPAQYQNYTPPQQYQAPAAMQHVNSHYPQMPQQPPMPYPAYGYPQPKSKIAAGLLGIFLGGLGIHRFYLGYTAIGVIQLVLTLFVGVFTFGLVGLWGVIEGIMILAGANYFRQDARGIPLRD